MKKSNERTGRLFQILSFYAIFAAAVLTADAQTGKLTPVFDGRDDIKSPLATKTEEEFIKREVRKHETAIRESSNIECEEDETFSFGVSGMTSGSFTKPNVRQKAYLYELCRSGSAFGIGGIVVVENSQVVAHYVYGENGLDSDITMLPDINGNGLSEIMLIGGGTGQGYTHNSVEIIEFAPRGVNSFGIADTYEDNFGTLSARKSAKAFKIFAQTGKNPVYFRETYTRKSEEGRWLLTGKSVKYSLRRDYEPKFHKIS